MKSFINLLVPHMMCSVTERYAFCIRAGFPMSQLQHYDLSGSPSGAATDIWKFYDGPYKERYGEFLSYCLESEPPEGIQRM